MFASVVLLWLFFCGLSLAQPANISSLSDGFASALSSENYEDGAALLSGLADKWTPEDAFWRGTIQQLFGQQRPALEAFLKQHYRTHSKALNLLAVRLPILAETLASLFANSAPEKELLEYDVLRAAPHLPPPAQALVLQLRKKGVPVDAYLVQNHEKFADVRDEILGLTSSLSGADVALAINFAAVTHHPAVASVLVKALASTDPAPVQAAANFIASTAGSPNANVARALADAIDEAQDDATWNALVAAQAVIDPEAGISIVERAGGLKNLKPSARQAAAVLAVARSASPLRDEDAKEVWRDASSCDLRTAGTVYAARRANQARQGSLDPVSAAALQFLYPGADCNSTAVAQALDELAPALEAVGYLQAGRAFASALTLEPNEHAGEWISRAPRFCRAIRAAIPLLAEVQNRGTQLLVSGLSSCLASTDAEFAFLLNWAVSKSSQPTKFEIAQTLRSLAGRRMTEGQAKLLSDAMALPGIEPSVSQAMTELLASAGRSEALAAADRLLASSEAENAVPLLEKLANSENGSGQQLDERRTARLLELALDPRLRSRVLKLLSQNPKFVKPDDLAVNFFPLAVDKDHPLSVDDCLDFSLFGPVSSSKLALGVLAASQQAYTGNAADYAACAELLSPYGPAREIVVALAARRTVLLEAGSASDRLARLDAMASLWSYIDELPGEKAQYTPAKLAILVEAPQLAYSEPYLSAGAVEALSQWQDRAAKAFPDRQTPFYAEMWKRRAVLYASYAPAALLCQLTVWALLIAAYPRSVRVQSVIFYNPWARRVLALGYLDLVLLSVPAVRSLLFEPLRQAMLGKLARYGADASDPASYFGSSCLVSLELVGIDKSISRAETDALAGTNSASGPTSRVLDSWSGRVLLLGPSGRGKTSFIRHHLLSGNARFPAVFLTAEECAGGVPTALAARLGPLGRDADLSSSLVGAGKLDVYIDGLNEAPPTTRSEILNFVAENPGANLFLASQQLSEGLPSVQAFYLLPLSKTQMSEFLLSRAAFLDREAPVHGDGFRNAARTFLATFEEAASFNEEDGAAALRRDFYAKLANPMDLQTAADLISQGVEPDPLNLQRQQFSLVDAAYRRQHGVAFPVDQFAASVLKARLEGAIEIDDAAFPREVALLVSYKQALSSSGPVPNGQSVISHQFRHERISDFYLHFAFLGPDPSVRFAHVRDDRFGGVYDLLARILPKEEADELREVFVLTGVDSRDHRISDSFIQQLRWQRLLLESDPTWIADLDPPWANDALGEFRLAEQRRHEIDEALASLRQRVDDARSISRIVTARDPSSLLERVSAAFDLRGLKVSETSKPYSRELTTPDGLRLQLWAIASPGPPSATMSIAIRGLIADVTNALGLVVVNFQADLPPSQRDPSLTAAWRASLVPSMLRCASAPDLHEFLRSMDKNGCQGNLWASLSARFPMLVEEDRYAG